MQIAARLIFHLNGHRSNYEKYNKSQKHTYEIKRFFTLQTSVTACNWPTGRRDSGFRYYRQTAKRFERDGLPGEYRAPKPNSGGYHDPPRSLQEAPLASQWCHVLPAAPAFR